MTTLLTILHIASCILLIIVVLIQPDRGDGMAGAFGGMGGSVASGVKTLDVLWKTTIVLAVVFMGTALGLTLLDKNRNRTVAPPVSTAPPAP